jgi:aspartyl/glutamyl-tRNA(Asn/Gln) amidotransferase C subunit
MNRSTLLDDDIDVDDVMEYFATLDEIDLDDVEPTVVPVDATTELRKDTPQPCMEHDEALYGAIEDGYFVGPKPT